MNDHQIRIFPERATTISWRVDDLFFFELTISVIFVVLIAGAIIYFSLKYRRRSDNDVPPYTQPSMALEAAYITVPFVIMMVMFFWGAWIFVEARRPPPNAMQINVIGKQWMWKVQHPEGPREINSLHVPTGVPIKLVMTSQDVVHDFGLPDFRLKMDVVPGIYTVQWFLATRPGRYHLFCTQYCGDLHSRMVGQVVVMEPSAYQAWLAGSVPDEPPAVAGSRLFQSYGCAACHGQRAPTLAGLYMSQVRLDDGKTVLADENYLRESIYEPRAKLVSGYGPIMPSFRNQLTEEQVFDLIEYIKTLGAARNNAMPGNAEEGPATQPSTRPVNGYPVDRIPNQPPAREPPKYNETGVEAIRE